MLLRNRVKVEIFLVVVAVVGGRVDKRFKSLWILDGGRVHGFQNRTAREIVSRKTGPGERVWGGVFQTTHRRLRMSSRERRAVCGESVQNRMNSGCLAGGVFYRLAKVRGNAVPARGEGGFLPGVTCNDDGAGVEQFYGGWYNNGLKNIAVFP
jgi:hypothetical protein